MRYISLIPLTFFAVASVAACSSGSNSGGNATGGAAGAGAQGGQGSAGGAGAQGGMGGGTAGTSGSGSGGEAGSGPLASGIGGPCNTADDCDVPDPECLTDWPNGYCTSTGCGENKMCDAGQDCFIFAEDDQGNDVTGCFVTCTKKTDCNEGYTCGSSGACIPACETKDDCSGDRRDCNTDTGLCFTLPCENNTHCDGKLVCDTASGECKEAPCTTSPDNCPAPLKCNGTTGKCVPDETTGPGAGPGPTCDNLPERDCTANCGDIVNFEPDEGPGYWDYPLNGETQSDQYRSWIRRDVMQLVKYAGAYTACKDAAWTTGTGGALGLGDMSEENGAIPGTREGQPGHPAGTHTNGRDMDIAYFQMTSPDNKLRVICPHSEGTQDQYHCTETPNNLDVWRSALFIGALLTSPQVRVLGVDGRAGPLIEAAMDQLCSDGWLPQSACMAKNQKLAYEVTDGGAGWYHFHHHHFHISFNGTTQTLAPISLGDGPLTLEERLIRARALGVRGDGHGHGIVAPPLQSFVPRSR